MARSTVSQASRIRMLQLQLKGSQSAYNQLSQENRSLVENNNRLQHGASVDRQTISALREQSTELSRQLRLAEERLAALHVTALVQARLIAEGSLQSEDLRYPASQASDTARTEKSAR